MRGPIRGVSLHKSLHYGHLTKFSVGLSGGNSEKIVQQPEEVFFRKHRAHCLNAVPGYWFKIAEHC